MKIPPPPAEWISDKPGRNFVLLHGMVMAPAFWSVFAPEVTLDGRTVAYPLPGHHPWSLPVPGASLSVDQASTPWRPQSLGTSPANRSI